MGLDPDLSQVNLLLALRGHTQRVSKKEFESAETRLREFEDHYMLKRVFLLPKKLARPNFHDVVPKEWQIIADEMLTHPRHIDMNTGLCDRRRVHSTVVGTPLH